MLWAVLVAPLLLGMGLALCMPPTPLGVLVLVPLIFLLTRGGGRYGFWAGIGFWAVHLIWLPLSFVQLFDTPWGAVPYFPLVAVKAAMWAAVFGLSKGRPLARVGLWALLEYLTSLGDIAFPWGFMGYALVEAPGRVLAAVGGIYLLSLVVMGTALALYMSWKAFRQDMVIVSLPFGVMLGATLFWVVLWVAVLPKAAANQSAALIQGNINPLERDWESAPDIYRGLSVQALAKNPLSQLVVWPESAVLSFPFDLAEVLGRRTLISGTFVEDRNSAVRWYQGTRYEVYAKQRLVPFGESFPFQSQLPWLYRFFFRALGFQGDLRTQQPGNASVLLDRFGTFICYESVFPQVSRRLTLAGAEALVLVSNDAWYGPSFGGLQHFQMGRLRAVETGRWLLRAGNDGVTAIIDPYGRVTDRIPQRKAGFLIGQYAYTKTPTPYTQLGDWWILLALGLVVVGAFYRKPNFGEH
jgi:apolipoprotein N-acyltransferase